VSVSVDIVPATGALVVHDVVNDFVDRDQPGFDPEIDQVLDNVALLLEASRRAALPVVFIGPGRGDPAIGPSPSIRGRERLVWGTQGVEVPARFGPGPGDTVVRKPRYGGFFGSRLADHLRNTGRDTIVVCGLSLAGGVETTIRDAFNHDFKSVVVGDACLCRPITDQGWGDVGRGEVRKVIFSVLAQRFARVATVRQVCDELADFG
jgi:ureidoacrylate peracid hydrolase